uniref:Uncharacterized protein n=1 Tax=Strongyloides venezuelensis TaxID=75913 RepID=A0A0K0G3H7_STRVS
MKVFIALTFFLIVVILKTFIYNTEQVSVTIEVKPKCECSGEGNVAVQLNVTDTSELSESAIPEITISFNHSCTWWYRQYLYIYNVSRDCKKNFNSNGLKQIPNDKYNFLCDESKMKIIPAGANFTEEEE